MNKNRFSALLPVFVASLVDKIANVNPERMAHFFELYL